MYKWILPVLLLSANFSFAQKRTELKLEEIMAGDEFIGRQPENIKWTKDGLYILFDWNPFNQPQGSTYAYDIKNQKRDSVTADFLINHPIDHDQNSFFTQLYTVNGNLYRLDPDSKKARVVIQSSERIQHLQRFNNDLLYFSKGDGFFSYSVKDGAIVQILQFVQGEKPEEKSKNHLQRQQEELFDHIRNNERDKDWKKEHDLFRELTNKIVYYSKGSISNIQISPDGKYLSYRIDYYPENKQTEVQHNISADGYTYIRKARPKVSDEDPSHSFHIFNLLTDSSLAIDFSKLSDIRKKPAYLKIYGDTVPEYQSNRKIIMHSIHYSDDGKRNVMDIRSYDNKDRWLVEIDLQTGTVRELEHQHDEAWIGGPGISGWNMVEGTLGFLKDNETIYFQSEESGFSHLYTYNPGTGKKTALTSGNWEVLRAMLSEKGDKFYLTTNKSHPGNQSFYYLNISDKKLTPVFENDGAYEVVASPDEKYLAVRYSYSNKPWELYLSPNKAAASLKQITHSTTAAFDSYDWYDPKIVEISGQAESPVYARLYEADPSVKNNAAVIFVHGAGYLQNAHKYWSTYHREYLFHNFLRDQGFTVIDIDYRASSGYGRDHRTAIYRHMGGADLDDQLLGKKYLVDSLGIDPERVGIYGGSYGGFITLMALLTKPGEFKCGAALRAVTDWNHYNHEYTSNILNSPGTDSIAYRKSSPIYFAENLEDRLLILHGMIDDNVQFQDVVRLSQRFIELRKTNWEMAVFPVEAHGFKTTSSWIDEYRRIYELFLEELITE